MKIRRSRTRSTPTPMLVSTEETLTAHVDVDVLGRELHIDRWATIERAAESAARLVREQLDAVSTYDRADRP